MKTQIINTADHIEQHVRSIQITETKDGFVASKVIHESGVTQYNGDDYTGSRSVDFIGPHQNHDYVSRLAHEEAKRLHIAKVWDFSSYTSTILN